MHPESRSFEIHITVEILSPQFEPDFVKLCEQMGVKPLLIELERGKHRHQPVMAKATQATSLETVLREAATYIDTLYGKQIYDPIRTKIRIPAADAHHINVNPLFGPYFEWHGKVPYERTDELRALCEEYGAHLSHNALKGATHTRHVTLREPGTRKRFTQRVAGLVAALGGQGWPVTKQQSTYCIYDSHETLDTGWLTGT